MQIGYMYHLWQDDHKVQAANVGSHFITNNLLMFGFVMLWVRGLRFFWVAELLLIVNFFNLTFLYLRHPKTPLLVHIPVVSGPLAWNFVALFWCGAAMVNATNLAARILANIAVWGWLVYGFFFLVVYKDWTMGFALSILSACMKDFAITPFGVSVTDRKQLSAFINSFPSRLSRCSGFSRSR